MQDNDLISRAALVNDLSYCAPELFFDKDFLLHKIMRQPVINAVPVVHGRWVKVEDFVWKCSICGNEDCYAYTWGEVKRQDDLFCPHCGATMDGDDDEAD